MDVSFAECIIIIMLALIMAMIYLKPTVAQCSEPVDMVIFQQEVVK